MARDKHWQSNVLAGAATVHEGLFLLLKRSRRETFLPDVWGIPAGQVRQAEDPREACGRELTEETGISGRVVQLLGYSTFQSKRNGIELSNLQLNFLVLADDSDVRIDPRSHSAYRWIPLDDIENEIVDDFTRKVMQSALSCYADVARR